MRQNGDFVMSTYSMTVAGLQRELPICKVTDDLYKMCIRDRGSAAWYTAS